MENREEKEIFQTINAETKAFIQSRYSTSDSVKDRFFCWWTAFTEFFNDRPFDLVYMDQLTVSGLYQTVGADPSSRYYSETREILKERQEQGIMKEGDLRLLNQFVRVAIVNVMKLNLSNGLKLSPEEIQLLVGLCWDGLKKPT